MIKMTGRAFVKKLNKMSLLFCKTLLSFCLAYVLAFIGRELISYGFISFIFILLSISLGFFYFIRPYRWTGLLIAGLILAGLAFLMRFYVTLAYSSG